MTTQTEMQEKVVNWLADVDRQEKFINGTAGETVQLRDGRVLKTMATLENEAQINVDAAIDAANTAESGMIPFPTGGDLPGGVPVNLGSWLIAPPNGAVVAATQANDPLLVARGVDYKINLATNQQAALRCEVFDTVAGEPETEVGRLIIRGDYVVGSVLIGRQDGAAWPAKTGGTEFISLGTVPVSQNNQQAFVDSVPVELLLVEEIAANLRRYVVGGKLTNIPVNTHLQFLYLLVTNTSASPISASGFGMGAEARYRRDILYRAYDPNRIAATTRAIADLDGRLAALEGAGEGVEQGDTPIIVIGGDLPGGVPSGAGSWFIPPGSDQTVGTVEPATDPRLTDLGIDNGVNLNAAQGIYLAVQSPGGYGNGDYVLGSVIVLKNGADQWPADGDFFTISNVPTGGAQQAIAQSAGSLLRHYDLGANLRRYTVSGQFVSLGGPLNFSILFPHAFGIPVKVYGFAMALSHTPIEDVAWLDWDGTDEGGGTPEPVQNEARMLVPVSIPLVVGQPLTIFNSRLSEWGLASTFRYGVVGRGAADQRVRWGDQKQLILDGAGLGAGSAIMAQNKQGLSRRAVNFRVSAAAKNAPWKVLTIGDSLSQQGQTSILETYLKAMLGANNVTMLGTFKDTGGTWGETRASWSALSYTWASTAVNGDGSGQLEAVEDAGMAAYLALDTPYGGPNDDYGPRWNKNVFTRAAVAGDPAVHVNNGRTFDFARYLARTNFPVPDAVDINLYMNDFLRGFNVADTMRALNTIYTRIRAVSANIHINFGLFGHGDENSWAGIQTFLKAVMQTYGNREGERIWIVPLHLVADPEIGYSMTYEAADAFGNQIATKSDNIHPPRLGATHAQWARLRANHHMTLIPA